jgi:hypothetical protein
MGRNQCHDTEFRAIDRAASDWTLHRARLADRHGADAVDGVLAARAVDGQVAMARQEVARYRWTLGKPDLTPAWRHRTANRLTAAGDWLQRALTARMALDRQLLPAPQPYSPAPRTPHPEGDQSCPMPPET